MSHALAEVSWKIILYCSRYWKTSYWRSSVNKAKHSVGEEQKLLLSEVSIYRISEHALIVFF